MRLLQQLATITVPTFAEATLRTEVKISKQAIGEPVYKVETVGILLNPNKCPEFMASYVKAFGKDFIPADWQQPTEGCLLTHKTNGGHYIRCSIMHRGSKEYQTADGTAIQDETILLYLPKKEQKDLPIIMAIRLDSVQKMTIL